VGLPSPLSKIKEVVEYIDVTNVLHSDEPRQDTTFCLSVVSSFSPSQCKQQLISSAIVHTDHGSPDDHGSLRTSAPASTSVQTESSPPFNAAAASSSCVSATAEFSVARVVCLSF
jgi:hypothetical protein